MRRSVKAAAKRALRLQIKEEVLAFIEATAADSPAVETGGILAGLGSLAVGEVVITKASPPGPQALTRHHYFSRDTIYCQGVLDQWVFESQGRVDYIGEWHKHFEVIPHPSFLDIATLRNIAVSSSYHVQQAILLIIGESNCRSSLKSFVIDAKGNCYTIDWIGVP